MRYIEHVQHQCLGNDEVTPQPFRFLLCVSWRKLNGRAHSIAAASVAQAGKLKSSTPLSWRMIRPFLTRRPVRYFDDHKQATTFQQFHDALPSIIAHYQQHWTLKLTSCRFDTQVLDSSACYEFPVKHAQDAVSRTPAIPCFFIYVPIH